MDEEHGQVSAGLGLAKNGVHIFTSTMFAFHEAEHSLAPDDLMNFRA